MNGIAWIEDTVQDLRHARRQLVRSPVFTGIAILTLALGIGSTTAIFSVVEAVLLRPLPYPEANRLVRIIERSAESANDIGYQQSLAVIWTRDLPVLRARVPTLSPVGVYSSAAATVDIAPGNSARLDGTRLSPSVFEMLGARPALGRIFLPTEEAPSTEPVVVLSHSMWQQYFGGQPDVLGRTITVDGKVSTIVGVMPHAFQFPDADTRFWLPYILDARMARVAPIARIADGVGIEAASANVEAVLPQIRRTEPRIPGRASTSAVARFEVRTIQEQLVAPVRPLIVVLASAVAFVLLIACVNVTNLLLNRNAVRRQELAVRVALGASPARVARYVLTETLLLATCGGAAGVLLAFGIVSTLRTLGTGLARRDLTPGVSIPRLEEIGINGTALLFTVAMTLGVGLLVGLLPIVQYALARHGGALKDDLSSIASVHTGPSRGGRAALLVAQTALATMALVGGGLLVHSFLKLSNVDPTTYVSSVREALRQMDSSAVIDNVASMQQVVSNALSRPRLFAVLAAAFAMVGAFLAAIGIYGVTAYAVTQRTRELAVRLALGARPSELLVLVVRQGLAWTIVGLSLGVAGSVAVSRYLQGVLFGITPVDPTTFAVVSAAFLMVAVLATWIPARRITRVDPLVALRLP